MRFRAVKMWRIFLCLTWIILLTPSISMASLTTEITRATMELLQEEGHALEDILAAETLMLSYGADLEEILQARKDGISWFTIIDSLGLDKSRYHRLASDDIATLLRKGIGAEHVITGNLMAQRFHFDIQLVLILKQDEAGWVGLFESLYDREQRRVRASLENQITRLETEGLSPKIRGHLTSSQIERHVARGLDQGDLERAIYVASEHGVDVELVASVISPKINWTDAERLLKRLKTEIERD